MKANDLPASESEFFEVLPGLPGFGPIPEQFTATGHGTHSEGFVVRFNPRSSDRWVGNFVSGFAGYTGAFIHPDGRTAIIISGGQAYHVDPATRSLLRHFGGGITEAIVDANRNLLILSDGIRLWALDRSGQRWETERLSWDGTRGLRIEGQVVAGEAYDPMGDKWVPFAVSLETGKVNGGSYRSRFY
jgi:hypothetical protein